MGVNAGSHPSIGQIDFHRDIGSVTKDIVLKDQYVRCTRPT